MLVFRFCFRFRVVTGTVEQFPGGQISQPFFVRAADLCCVVCRMITSEGNFFGTFVAGTGPEV